MPLDPVCGMKVDASSPIRAEREGEMYYFCSESCRRKFIVQGSVSSSGSEKPCCGGHNQEAEKPAKGMASGIYVCPMCPKVRQDHPGDCPVCGMPLEPEFIPSGHTGETSELGDMRLRFWLGLVMTIPIFVLSMGHISPSFLSHESSGLAQFFLCLPVVYWAGWPLLKRAARSLANWNLNMFTLIGMGVLAAFGFSAVLLFAPRLFPEDVRGQFYFESAAVITVLVLLGQMLELRARNRTGQAIRYLLNLAPSTARKLDATGERDVNLAEVHPGDVLRVRPGARVPVDGVVIEGESFLDEAMLTGESEPVRKTMGMPVTAGTVNGSGSFLMRAEHVCSETVLARIVEMVARAQRSRAPIQRLADRVSGVFVPAVVAVALVAFGLWMSFGPDPRFEYALVSAISVLVIACPCALGLATPMSVMVGVGRGAKAGVFIKDAATLETLENVDTIIVDKTGTLTEGKPFLTGIIVINGVSESDLLSTAGAVEQGSEHPLARAILRAAEERNVALSPVSGFQATAGAGIEATLGNGTKAFVGTAEFLRSKGIASAAFEQLESNIDEVKGQTAIFVAKEGVLLGALTVSDPLKETSVEAVRALHAMGYRVIMLSGDRPEVVKQIAEQLGIDDFTAGMRPEQKRARVAELQKQNRKVLMAGDGINDAPALAQADLGIDMVTGRDIAMESAGITLLHGDLRGIVRAITLSRAVMRNIRQNLFFAFIYNLLGVPIAAGLLFPVFGITLNPMIAGAAMSLSSVCVITNALRLRNWKP